MICIQLIEIFITYWPAFEEQYINESNKHILVDIFKFEPVSRFVSPESHLRKVQGHQIWLDSNLRHPTGWNVIVNRRKALVIVYPAMAPQIATRCHAYIHHFRRTRQISSNEACIQLLVIAVLL